MTMRQLSLSATAGSSVGGQFRVGNDDSAGARIAEDMGVIGGGVGGVGRHGDGAGGHDGEIGEAPFGAVFADQHHPVPRLDTEGDQCRRQAGDQITALRPALRLPAAIGLA